MLQSPRRCSPYYKFAQKIITKAVEIAGMQLAGVGLVPSALFDLGKVRYENDSYRSSLDALPLQNEIDHSPVTYGISLLIK